MNAERTLGTAPALLGDATWYGTLAAVRDLGRRGVPVTLATDAALAPARFSRYVTRTVRAPGTADQLAHLMFLRDFAARYPRHALHPTGDESAWILCAHRDELSRSFFLHSPPLASLAALLDKAQLQVRGRDAGLDVPESWAPHGEEDVVRLARELTYPVYVKPRTQVFVTRAHKGSRVDRPEDLLPAWRRCRAAAPTDPRVRQVMPGVDLPLVQACEPRSARIYTVDGFVDATGELWATRACAKVLQRPRGSGPGIVFEHATIDPRIDRGLRAMFVRAGFYGVFDAEFLESGSRRLLIDVNPRLYNHMAFEIDRDLPLPWLSQLAACGLSRELEEAVAEARVERGGPRSYVHRLSLGLMLPMQALSGAMPREELRRWRRVLTDRGATDPARWDGDAAPAVAELAYEALRFVAHPRSYLRKLSGSV